MATIKDVAKKAGVSISTVSYVLNNKGKVSEATRERVLQIAQELNYIPNTFAKGLKKKQYELVALIVHEIKGPFYDSIVRGIQDVLHSFGYNLLIFCTLENRREDINKFLRTGIVNGFLVLTPAVKTDDILKWAHQFKIVTLDRIVNDNRIKSVRINNEKGAYEVVKYLNNLGHKKIGFMKGSKDSLDARERFRGFSHAMHDLKLEIDQSLIFEGDFTEESGYKIMKNFIKKNKKKNFPTALFCANDEMAIGALKALKEENIDVPNDISLIGFDDIELSSYVSPALTTVRRPMYQLGSIAAHMLLSMLNEKNERTEGLSNVVLDVELIIRESTKGIL
ncbi:MAG: LacI family DNA-binding transcriptional regulator [Candidatus Kryptonium sp.]